MAATLPKILSALSSEIDENSATSPIACTFLALNLDEQYDAF